MLREECGEFTVQLQPISIPEQDKANLVGVGPHLSPRDCLTGLETNGPQK